MSQAARLPYQGDRRHRGQDTTFSVDAHTLNVGNILALNGTQVAAGAAIDLIGGAGDDHLVTRSTNDRLQGNGGADHLDSDDLHAANYPEFLVYTQASDLTGAVYDTLAHFSADEAKLELWMAVTGVDMTIVSGRLGSKHFDKDLAAAVDLSHLAAHHAVLLTPDDGRHAGETFLVVDTNSHAGYQSGKDLFIKLTDIVDLDGFSTANFTTPDAAAHPSATPQLNTWRSTRICGTRCAPMPASSDGFTI